jgi:hypothetical protein
VLDDFWPAVAELFSLGVIARRMKITFTNILAAWLLASSVCAAPPERQFSGKVQVDGLGLVAFPPGKWSLEFARTQPAKNDAKRPDYFVFKKTGDRVQRLAFLRYSPVTAPKDLYHLMDSLVETMGDGVPPEETKDRPAYGPAYPMRREPQDVTGASVIEFSFISTRASTGISWLCHTVLFSKDGWAFVIVHTSPYATSPELIQDVHFRSRLSTDAKTSSTTK